MPDSILLINTIQIKQGKFITAPSEIHDLANRGITL